jgi:YD repeat-containing protein
VLTESFFDGAGRVRQSRVPHSFNTDGTTATWAGTETEYDILGRVSRQSVPTEVDSAWAAAGDDAARGFLWTYQKYDWKGRVVRRINTDGIDQTTLNDSDVLISYDGCGCAGGQVTTIQGELVPRTDGVTGNARRTQKIYEDILGRVFKKETFLWNGTDVYARTETDFNGRNQASAVTQTEVATSVAQTMTFTYDGHGRLATEHSPQKGTGTVKSYTYNKDDSISTVTDARGAVTHYAYGSVDDSTSSESRMLLTKVSWSVPFESEIPSPHDVSLVYDNVGNRTSMTDALGTQSYAYDSLSEISSETRQFNDTLANAPQGNNSFTIGYTYTISGQLQSLTEPWGVTVNYTSDKRGRLVSVAPSTAYGGVSQFATNARYRAWGALEHLEYSNGATASTTFDNRLRPSTFQLATSSTTVMNKTYGYYSDGNLEHVDDAVNSDFDRLNTYDHQGRIYQAKSSNEANGGTVSDQVMHLPYRETYAFNAFGDLAGRTNHFWGTDKNFSYTFSNHRISGWTYDSDGRVTESFYPDQPANFEYDAAGQLILKHDHPTPNIQEDKTSPKYDGDGREIKRITDSCRLVYVEDDPPPEQCDWQGDEVSYYIRSTVLGGQIIADVGSTGNKINRYVYAWGGRFAELSYRFTYNPNETHDAAQYYHLDPLGISQRVTRNSPETLLGTSTAHPNYIDPRHAELDAMGANAGTVSNYTYQPAPPESAPIPLETEAVFYIDGQFVPATMNGLSISVQALEAMSSAGILVVEPGGKNRDLAGRIGHWEDSSRTWLEGTDEDGNPIGHTEVDTWFVVDDKPLPDKLVDKIRAQLDKIATKDCRDELAKVFAETERLTKGTKDEDTAVSSDPLSLFDAARKQGGIFLGNHSNSEGTTTVSTGYGSIGTGDAKVVISANVVTEPYSADEIRLMAFLALRELVHMAGHKKSNYIFGAFSDVNLAKASHSLGRGPILDQPQVGLPEGLLMTQYPGDAKINPFKDTFSQWSRYNHDSINRYCRLNPEEQK